MTADHAAARRRYPGKSNYSEAEYISMTETKNLIEYIAISAIVDTDAFPDPGVANYVARWVRGFLTEQDYEISTKGIVSLEVHEDLKKKVDSILRDGMNEYDPIPVWAQKKLRNLID